MTVEDEMVRQLNGHEFPQMLEDSGGEKPGVLWSMGSQRVRRDLAPERQQKI